jgi:GT2 family glycosyltransferase
MTSVAAVIIGRNEGERLVDCLASLGQGFERVIYVESGSIDGSVAAAKAAGADVVDLDTSFPFTAARARNAGIDALRSDVTPDLVQFLDGDCTLDETWLDTAKTFLADHPKIAVVCGRRRERFPETSVYNRLCDAEWNTPIGEATACGGDALMRWDTLEAVGGYNLNLIAGEEPEMCLRMRRAGWTIWRLDAEMTLHDAAMTRFSQFWNRAKRSGYAFAQAAAMYGKGPERHGVTGTRRALFWGLVLPLAILLGAPIIGGWVFAFVFIYPVQVCRMALRNGGGRFAWEQAVLLTLGKFAEASGVLTYHWRRLRGHQADLIEYK